MQGCALSVERRSKPLNTCATSLRVFGASTDTRVFRVSVRREPRASRARTRLKIQRQQLRAHVCQQLALGGLLCEQLAVLVLGRLVRCRVAVQHRLHVAHVLDDVVKRLWVQPAVSALRGSDPLSRAGPASPNAPPAVLRRWQAPWQAPHMSCST